MKVIKENKIILPLIILLIIIGSCAFFVLNTENEEKTVNQFQTLPATSTTAQSTTEPTIEEDSLSFSTIEEANTYLKEYAKENGYDIKDYPKKLIELMVKDSDAIDFVLDYPSEIKKEHDSKIEIDSFDEIPLLLQWDKHWGYHQFKDGVVGLDGCGAACASMALMYLNQDTTLTPDTLADYISDNGYFIDGSGTIWEFFNYGMAKYGVQTNIINKNENNVINAINNKHPIIVSVGKGDFTKKGHYIVISGYKDGKFKVNDPFSAVNSSKMWSWEKLNPQIRQMWEIYK